MGPAPPPRSAGSCPSPGRPWPNTSACSTGEITFGPDKVEAFTVLEVQPPTTFSFRWTQPAGEPATADNSLFVTFELVPSGAGTLLKLSETGFREEQLRQDHITGWDYFLPRIAPYVATLEVQP